MLDGIVEGGLEAALNPKSRTVWALFAHMHNVRLMWLKSAAPDLLGGLEKVEPKPTGTPEDLRFALEASGRAVESLLEQTAAEGGRVKGFKPHATAFLAYLISHESHHRGQIEWALRAAGMPLDDKTSYGLWEWGAR
jgi:uncharacterized damage-inducible protein DinB